MDFEKKVLLRVRNSFPPKSNIAEVFAAVLEQRIPGELHVVVPGNGGVTAMFFIEKERILDAEDTEA